MNYLHNYIGLLGCLLVLLAVPLTIFKRPRHSRKTINIAIFSLLAIAILPVNDLTLLAYIRAGLGDISITSLILLCISIASSYTGRQYITPQQQYLLENSLLIGAAILYPLALGLTPVDTYAGGYGGFWLFGVLLIFAVYLLWRQAFLILALLLIAICAYLLNALQSNNLWDYLLDPWIIIFVIIIKLMRLKRSNTQPVHH